MKYKLTDHTADFGLRIYGQTLEELFENAAFALVDMITDVNCLKGVHKKSMMVEGEDTADLMVNWLRELLYFWNGKEKIVAATSITQFSENHLKADLTYDDYEEGMHEIKNEIKAVTYHQLDVHRSASGWVANVIVDV